MMNSQDNIDVTISKLKEGNTAALDTIFKIYYPYACRFADKLINNDEIAKELASSAFLIVWKKRRQLNTTKDLQSFLFTCLRNLCIDHLRKLKRTIIWEKENKYNPVDSETPYDDKIDHDQLETFYKAIEQLPNQQRIVIKLHLKGHTTSEIAESLMVTVKTVQNTRLAASKNLQNQILTNINNVDENIFPFFFLCFIPALNEYFLK